MTVLPVNPQTLPHDFAAEACAALGSAKEAS